MLKKRPKTRLESEDNHIVEWGPRLKGGSSDETENALYDHLLVANPNKALDAGNIAKVVAWYQENGNLTKLVEAFTLAKAQSKTLSAKYVLKVLRGK